MLRIQLHLVAAVLVVTTFSPMAAHAQQDGDDAFERMRKALADGDVEAIIQHAGARIDLTVFGTSELLSRSQARYVLRSFFAEYPPLRVDVVDSSLSSGHWFATAGYWFEAGSEPLSAYLRLQDGARGWELRELRFERSSPR